MEREARRPFINRIVFVGNEHISGKELKKRMHTKESTFFAIFRKPRLRRDFLRKDIAMLEAYYHTHGFFEAAVRLKKLEYSEDGRFVDVIIEIEEGEATLVDEIALSGSIVVGPEKLKKRLMLKPGMAFNPSLLSSDVYEIKRAYSNKGYLAASVADSLHFKDHRVKICYRVKAGPRIKIGRIRIMGNELTKGSIILKEMTFNSKEIFNLEKVIESQRNLFDTGLFTEVELKPENLNLDGKTVDITVRLRERKASYIEVGFGVGNILGSRILAEWGDRNILGTGRKLRLRSEYSFEIFKDNRVGIENLGFKSKFARYDGAFNQRHLFGTKVLLGINSFYEKDATVEPITISTIGASINASRRLSRFTDLLLSLSHERIKRDSPEIQGEISTSRIFSTSLSRDRRDFILNPRRGSYRLLRFQIAGGILRGDNHFYTVVVSQQKYFTMKNGMVVALRTRLGFADAFGPSKDTGVPIENRFFAGGGNSVRGYRENTLGPRGGFPTSSQPYSSGSVSGGRVLVLTNAEIRFPIPYLSRFHLSGAAFVDGGNVWASLRDVKFRHFRPYATEDEVIQQDYRYSFGAGIRYNTPVGPIRVDYGIPVKREPWMERAGRFHVSLGQIF